MNIEPLELRIAPAAVLVNATTFTYTDIDGDAVTVKTTGGPFVFTNGPNGDFGDSFVFTTANAIGGQQLVYVDLTLSGFAGEDLTFSVVKAGAGDGLAAVGYINAQGVDLGAVTVKGDLNEIDCGDANTATPGLELLSVRSLGRYGDATDLLVPGLTSDIKGALGSLRVSEDIKDARIAVSATVLADARIGSVAIGGSLIGGAAADSGSIGAAGGIGSVTIGGSLIGGGGFSSGLIGSDDGLVGNVTIGGSLIGGAGTNSGLLVGGELGAVKIGGNVKGGTEANSGNIRSVGKIASVTIGGSLLGGAAMLSGSIFSGGDIGPVKIAHDVKGGAGNESGKIDAGGRASQSLSIGGSLLGGDGDQDTTARRGQIAAVGDIGAITIGHDVKGGSGDDSARIAAGGMLGAITIGGSLLGGSAQGAGSIGGAGGIGAVKIGHDILGGSESFTALISTDGPLASVTVGGSLIGGTGNDSGSIKSEGNLGPVKIGHDVMGGSAPGSGNIRSSGALAAATVGGSVFGGSSSDSGSIVSSGGIGTVTIGHDLVGGSIAGTAPGLDISGAILSAKRIASVTIGGSIITGADASTAGSLMRSATIRAADDIGSVTVKGGLIGNVTPNGNSFVVISARGQATPGATSDVAIGKISIGGRVEFAQIFGGYRVLLNAENADAQIGSVTVGADWIASSIVAGAFNTGADLGPGDDNIDFGNPFDEKIAGGTDEAGRFSKIGSIAIAGQVFGQPGSSPQFGFVSEEIGALKIGVVAFTLTASRGNDGRILAPAFDVALHELGAPFLAAPLPASAKLINASTVTYDDIDGDHVTVRLSKPLLTAGNVNDVFKLDAGAINDGINARQQLQLLDLRSLAAAGLSITITVAPGGGDRLANVGAILADEDLGTITVPGDLGQIGAGDANAATRGLAALNVRTFGRLGLDTQPAAFATFTPFLGGDILGSLGALTVRQDIAGASLAISGSLGSLTIGGSLIGGSAAASGTIVAAGAVGAVKIGHHIQAGASSNSGYIDVGTSIASVSVGGSLIGGSINADGATLGPVSVAHNVLGGSTAVTGRLSGNTGVGNVTIGGSLLGGGGESSGRIFNSGGNIGAVKIGHNVIGGAGNESGKIDSAAKIAGVSIGGSLLGGSGDQSTFSTGGVFHRAQVFALGNIGTVTIGHDVLGAAGVASARIFSIGNLTSVTVGGSVVGGAENDSARISANGGIGPVKIAHNLLGDAGQNSGSVSALTLADVTIGGSLVGGSANSSGQVNGNSALGAVKIGHDVHGGSALATGYLVSNLKIASVTIGGSLVGGSANLTGGIFPTELGPVKIGRDLIGGSIAGTAATLERSGFIQAQDRIASVSIGGSIIAGSDASTVGVLKTSGSIRTDADLGALVVKGSLIGNVTANGATPVIISARGEATPTATRDLAIDRIDIGGSVEHALILAGYTTAVSATDTYLAHANNRAQIGSVRVGRDWFGSSLVAGILNPGAGFGDGNDVLGLVGGGGDTIARIAIIVIGGTVTGTAAPGADHFGFVSVTIGSFKSLNFTAPLTVSVTSDVIELSPLTGDVTLREV